MIFLGGTTIDSCNRTQEYIIKVRGVYLAKWFQLIWQPRSQGLSSLPPLSFSQRQWRQRRETLGTRLEKSREVSIKKRSPPASLSFKGQATKQETVKWSIFLYQRMPLCHRVPWWVDHFIPMRQSLSCGEHVRPYNRSTNQLLWSTDLRTGVNGEHEADVIETRGCLLYTSPSPRDA